MKKAVIIVAQGFEDTEFAYPFYRLQEAGFEVDVATKGKVDVKGKHGVAANATVDAENIQAQEYDLAVVPGGRESPDRVRQIANVQQFLKDCNREGKIIASICHGPWVLISAGIVSGRQVTSYPGCKDDLVNAGGYFQDASVVVDGNLITAVHYRDNAEWMKATLAQYENYNQPAVAGIA